jgi:hypothetical protein
VFRPCFQVQRFAILNSQDLEQLGDRVAGPFNVFVIDLIEQRSDQNASINSLFFASKSQIHAFVSSRFKTVGIFWIHSVQVPMATSPLNGIAVSKSVRMEALSFRVV